MRNQKPVRRGGRAWPSHREGDRAWQPGERNFRFAIDSGSIALTTGKLGFPVKTCTFGGGHPASVADGGTQNNGLTSWIPTESWKVFTQF